MNVGDLGPGWADRLPKTVEQEQVERESKGWRPRKAWRGNGDVKQESRLRGARSRGKLKLPELQFPEDEK